MGKALNGKELGSGIHQRKDGTYEAKIYVKARKKCFSLYSKDLKKLKKKQMQYLMLTGNPHWDCTMSVSEWFEHWMELYIVPGRKRTTVRNYRDGFNRVKDQIGDCWMIRVTPAMILSVLYDLKKEGYAYTTVKQSLAVLKGMFSKAFQSGIILSDPCIGIRVPVRNDEKVVREAEEENWLSEQDCRKFFELSEGTRWHELFLILRYTGLRIGEACALEWKDVDLDNKLLYVYKTLNRVPQLYDENGNKVENQPNVVQITSPKRKYSIRVVPLCEEVVTAFQRWERKQKKDKARLGKQWGNENPLIKQYPDPVFTTKTGNISTPDKILPVCTRLEKRLNKREEIIARLENREAHTIHVSPHLFRHRFIMDCVERELPLAFIKKISGHSKIQMTDYYTHLSEKYIMENFGQFFSEKI